MMLRSMLVLSVWILAAAGRAADTGKKTAVDDALAEAQARFARTLTGAKFEGHYTTWDNPDEPQRDSYILEKVSRIRDDLWLFVARIQYGEHDAKLPLPLRVEWAGLTPVITLNEVPVPGFGTFSARVVIHGEHYAGTWDGGDHGGHMYGRILKKEPAPAAETGQTAPAADTP